MKCECSQSFLSLGLPEGPGFACSVLGPLHPSKEVSAVATLVCCFFGFFLFQHCRIGKKGQNIEGYNFAGRLWREIQR